jgi:hypothetical protein
VSSALAPAGEEDAGRSVKNNGGMSQYWLDLYQLGLAFRRAHGEPVEFLADFDLTR